MTSTTAAVAVTATETKRREARITMSSLTYTADEDWKGVGAAIYRLL